MLETLLRRRDKKERCGLLLKDGTVVHIKNIAPNPEQGFHMDPEQLLPFVMDDKIAATWHTHPDGPPILSGEDYAGFLAWPELEHYIIGRKAATKAVAKYRVDRGAVISCD